MMTSPGRFPQIVAATCFVLITAMPNVVAQQGSASPPPQTAPDASRPSDPGPPGPGRERWRDWGPGMMMGPGMMPMMMGGRMCSPRGAGFAEWRLERMVRVIRPNEAQREKLNELRTASAKAADTIVAACPRDFPRSAPARLELMEKRLDAMLQAVKTVRPAFEAFYAALDEEQKARLNSAAPCGWGWRRWQRSNL